MNEFDVSDFLIAHTYFNVEGTSGSFDRWKAVTPDWSERIAKARLGNRQQYENAQQQTLPAHVREVITGQLADVRAKAAGSCVMKAVRAAMTEANVVVRATPEKGERRQLDRAELLAALIGGDLGMLELDGVKWRHVEVTMPTATTASDLGSIAKPAGDIQAQIRSWFDGLPADVTITEGMAKTAFPDLTIRGRRTLLKEVVPAGRLAKPGTAPSRRRSA